MINDEGLLYILFFSPTYYIDDARMGYSLAYIVYTQIIPSIRFRNNLAYSTLCTSDYKIMDHCVHDASKFLFCSRCEANAVKAIIRNEVKGKLPKRN